MTIYRESMFKYILNSLQNLTFNTQNNKYYGRFIGSI